MIKTIKGIINLKDGEHFIDEDELISILKRKLTKKEYKLLNFLAINQEEKIKMLKNYSDIRAKLIKKLHHPKIRNVILN